MCLQCNPLIPIVHSESIWVHVNLRLDWFLHGEELTSCVRCAWPMSLGSLLLFPLSIICFAGDMPVLLVL